MMNIGIVCEGPTDYVILKGIIDKITGESNEYKQLQPEANLLGEYGNGWKGVWKWCVDNASIKEKIMKDVEPTLDLLIVHMDGDVSRKEKPVHCFCESTVCENKGTYNPIECVVDDETRRLCPVVLPCADHEQSVNGYIEHLEKLIGNWLVDLSDTCIVIPCDSIESWIVAAYDEMDSIEVLEDPWTNIISRRKYYHDIRIPGDKKRIRIFEQFVNVVCANWIKVTELCQSARKFEDSIVLFHNLKKAKQNTRCMV